MTRPDYWPVSANYYLGPNVRGVGQRLYTKPIPPELWGDMPGTPAYGSPDMYLETGDAGAGAVIVRSAHGAPRMHGEAGQRGYVPALRVQPSEVPTPQSAPQTALLAPVPPPTTVPEEPPAKKGISTGWIIGGSLLAGVALLGAIYLATKKGPRRRRNPSRRRRRRARARRRRRNHGWAQSDTSFVVLEVPDGPYERNPSRRRRRARRARAGARKRANAPRRARRRARAARRARKRASPRRRRRRRNRELLFRRGPKNYGVVPTTGPRIPKYKSRQNPRCPTGMKVQSVIFSKRHFDKRSAKSWAKAHGYKTAELEQSRKSYRMRQRKAVGFTKRGFRTIPMTKGVSAVVGCPR